MQGRQFKRHLVTDDFSKPEVQYIHSNELEKKLTGTSGVMNKSSEKSPFSVAMLLAWPTVKSSTELTPEAAGTGWAGALLG